MSDSEDEIININTILMTLRKPTELKKIIDSVPKPTRAVPKNGLPMWYRLGLENKLPVPKMPPGKIVFSRGRVGEDVRRLGLGGDAQPTFDLTDPYCYTVNYDYVPMHDPHLAHYFCQKPARNRMKQLGYVMRDGRAVCSLMEFNSYRKYLYNRFQDRIHMEIKKLDERARDDLVLYRVNRDVNRRLQTFTRAERAREHMERVAQLNADEWAEKKRLAREQEKKIQQRLNYLVEYNEEQRKKRAAGAREKENRIKQRVTAAAEMELRRKITMVRQWRINEKRRLARLNQDREAKQKRLEDEAKRTWCARVDAQNAKIQQEALLLKIYSEDMAAGAKQRIKKSEKGAYETDLELQRIRLANLKLMHGGTAKANRLAYKMGIELEKATRGAKGMSRQFALDCAKESMSHAISVQGERFTTLAQARHMMDVACTLPSAPVKLLEQMLEATITEFTRRHINSVLSDVESAVRERATVFFFQNIRPMPPPKRYDDAKPRWGVKVEREMMRAAAAAAAQGARRGSIAFGEVINIAAQEETEKDMKSARLRPPTPVPSKTKLAEVTFSERLEDLPDAVTIGAYLPERAKLLEMMNNAMKLLIRSVGKHVERGLHIETGKVTIPNMRQPMEWGEAVESLTGAVVNNLISSDCVDVRRCSQFLARRVLSSLLAEMKAEKKRLKNSLEEQRDFYVPDTIQVQDEGEQTPIVTSPEPVSKIK